MYNQNGPVSVGPKAQMPADPDIEKTRADVSAAAVSLQYLRDKRDQLNVEISGAESALAKAAGIQ